MYGYFLTVGSKRKTVSEFKNIYSAIQPLSNMKN